MATAVWVVKAALGKREAPGGPLIGSDLNKTLPGSGRIISIKFGSASRAPEIKSSPHRPQMRKSRACLLAPYSSWTSSTQHDELSPSSPCPPEAFPLLPFPVTPSLTPASPSRCWAHVLFKNLDLIFSTCKLSHLLSCSGF